MQRRLDPSQRLLRAVVFWLALLWTAQAWAYIGPGAGFAVISSFFIFLATGFLAFFTILFWPLRAGILYFRRRAARKHKKVRRVVVLGLDGLDPGLCHRYMQEGKLPHLSRLAENGTFRPLATTKPSISPVAWSSFATGVNPGKHRVFDFYTRDPRSYLPVLSSAEIVTVDRSIKLGALRLGGKKTVVRFLRKATSFWTFLGRHGIFSSVLRVPISFPPEKFYGTSLAAMCAPDLRGTQGAFTCFCSHPPDEGDGFSDGDFVKIDIINGQFSALIQGPAPTSNEAALSLPFAGDIDAAARQLTLCIAKKRYPLTVGNYSPWIKLTFRAGIGRKISGIARFLLVRLEPDFRLYLTPINIDPEKPALPVSHPFYYAAVLAKLYGSFATLGLAEDTWALNEGAIDEQAFLDQSYDIYEDRKCHFLDALKKNKHGPVISVFDTSDRIQHMFFRYLDDTHPANTGKDTVAHKNAVPDLYERLDDLVGDVSVEVGPEDLLLIVSDHGFTQFKWGVNLNTWLYQNGYLVLKTGAVPGGQWLRDVDWSLTRAYAFGLTGIFINLKNRESRGIVADGNDRLRLQLELKERLEGLADETNGRKPIRRAMLAQMNLKGPYVDDAPDLIVGYARGYRASWNCAVGRITEQVVEPNTRRWSGDHAVDPDLVPGVLFTNWRLRETDPSIMDIGPTIQHLYGVPRDAHQDGRILHFQLQEQAV